MDLPVVDLDVFLLGPHNSDAVTQECKKVCINRVEILLSHQFRCN